METYGEVVYMILDNLKINADDSYYEEEHIINLIEQYRNLLLKQKYSDIRKEVSMSNFQYFNTDLIFLESTKDTSKSALGYLKSTLPIPSITNFNSQNITKVRASEDFWNGEIAFIDFNQFKYVGFDRWLQNIIYCTIGPDNHLYLKSNNPQYQYLKNINIISIFENPKKIYELNEAADVNNNSSILDKIFPVEGELIPMIIATVVKLLREAIYKPEDDTNNANDDLDSLENDRYNRQVAARRAAQ